MHFKRTRQFTGLFVSIAFLNLLGGCVDTRRAEEAKALTPPAPQREFRAVWVATVQNIDWPTRAGLSTEQQQKEIIDILDKCVDLKLNAVVLQVRTSCDAFYPSKLEPWSGFLTGTQGKAPEPYYDPLQMWVEESHNRGIELHAWFNPYRARTPGAKSPNAASHISQTNPAVVKSFNGYQWLDPGEQDALDLTYNVFMDVVKRYDVDGVHMDDYFYPYKEYLTDKDTNKASDFPDDPSWARYVESGGKLSRGDWRRNNVDVLVERLYKGVKKEKPWVQVGISPFGIARPGHPPTVKSSFNQYESLYADTQKWLSQGWVDYFTPQLYWKVGSEQPYEDLVAWWTNENPKGRHIWPGLGTYRIDAPPPKGYEVADIPEQIYITRQTPGATGHVHFSMKVLMQNKGASNPDATGSRGGGRRGRRGAASNAPAPNTAPTTSPSVARIGISEALDKGPYAEPALVPASPWLDRAKPAAPSFTVKQDKDSKSLDVSWKPGSKESPRMWAVSVKYGSAWKLHTFPPQVRQAKIAPDGVLGAASAVSVSAVDRSGNESIPARAKKPK